MVCIGEVGMGTPCQVFQDRAIRPFVTMAALDEVCEGVFHRLKFFKFLVQEIQMLLGKCLNFTARASFVLPQANQTSDFLNRKSQVTRTSDELKSTNVLVAVQTIPSIASICW